MTRFIAAVLTLSLCALGLMAPAGAAPSDRALPMRFELRQEGPAEACGRDCRSWIAAPGAITAETPREFKKFAEGRDLRGVVIALDSDGGSVLGAIALGREIRRLGLFTTVGRSVDIKGDGEGRATLNPRADCESMCAFVLLSGVRRHVPAGARVMVHQIWLGDRREDPTAANYSAEDLALVQRDIGRLARYTADMGGPMELIEMALRIPPWEPMRSLGRDDLLRMQLDTGEGAPERAPQMAAAAPIAMTGSAATPAVTAGLRANTLSEAAWSLVESSGAPLLMRRHALTFEGDEIGSFDLTVACAANDTYQVSYAERRRTGERVEPIASVTVRLGRISTVLQNVSSQRRTPSGDLETLATGTIPAALFDGFAAAGPHSMMIATRGGDLATAIRVGNTGVRRNLPQLVAGCQKAAGQRADLRTEKTGGAAVRQ